MTIIKLFVSFLFLVFLTGCGNEAVLVEHESQNTTEYSVEASAYDEQTASEEAQADTKEETGQNKEFPVYVCGAVRYPGVYYFTSGSIKQDALDSAGGFVDGAARWCVNLAENLQEGEKLYFPFEEELGEDVSPMEYKTEETSASEQGDSAGKTSLVNINTADKEELMSLSGVGESRAEAIIKYREAHGDFKDISDICNVSGIKEGLFNKIKDYITVG